MGKLTTILDYIKDITLALVDASGYYTNDLTATALISKNFREISDVHDDQFPAVFILADGPNRWSPLTAGEMTTGGGSTSDITDGKLIRLLSYVKTAETGEADITGPLTDAMDSLFGDLVLAMHSDRSLGGNVHACTLVGDRYDLEHWEKRVGVLEMIFSLKYVIQPETGSV